MHTIPSLMSFTAISFFSIPVFVWKAYAAVPDKDIESLFLAHPPHILFIGTGERLPSFNPVRQYMDWKNVSDNQLSMGIIDYVQRKISSGDLDKMKQKAEALRNAPPPPPYEGPLVVDMEDAAE